MKTFKQISRSNNKYVNDEKGYYKDCNRFLPYERNHDYTFQDAIVYEKLRDAGMNKIKAIKFCKAQHCKYDTTQNKIGPPGYKIFKAKIDKLRQLNGWQMTGKLNYNETQPREFCNDTEWVIQDTNKEEQEKMEQLKQFYTEMDEKYSFSNLNINETLTKLRSLSSEEQYRSRVPQYQIKDKKKQQIYYEMAEYILKLKKPPKTLIQDLNVFDNTIPLVRQEYYDIQPKKNDKAIPIYSQQNFEKRTKLLKELTRAYTGQVTVDEPTEDIKQVIQLYIYWLQGVHINQILTILNMCKDLNNKHQMNLYFQVQMIQNNRVQKKQNKDVVQ